MLIIVFKCRIRITLEIANGPTGGRSCCGTDLRLRVCATTCLVQVTRFTPCEYSKFAQVHGIVHGKFMANFMANFMACSWQSCATLTVCGVQVWNPAFDIAPGALIHGIITEQGLVPKTGAGFEVSIQHMQCNQYKDRGDCSRFLTHQPALSRCGTLRLWLKRVEFQQACRELSATVRAPCSISGSGAFERLPSSIESTDCMQCTVFDGFACEGGLLCVLLAQLLVLEGMELYTSATAVRHVAETVLSGAPSYQYVFSTQKYRST